MNKHHIWASAFAMLALTYGGKLLAQGRLDLAGQWEFQIDRADKGTADKWTGLWKTVSCCPAVCRNV